MKLVNWPYYAVLAVAVGVIIWQVVSWWLRARLRAYRWASLVGVVPFRYAVPKADSFDEALLIARFNRAAECLGRLGPWGLDATLAALSSAAIIILPQKEWEATVTDAAGALRRTTVAGQARVEIGTVVVGNDLAALCHELAHLAEYRLDKTVDYSHATWNLRGIQSAINEYGAT